MADINPKLSIKGWRGHAHKTSDVEFPAKYKVVCLSVFEASSIDCHRIGDSGINVSWLEK